jgi:5-methylcytosine-specific restriction enzyme subunit McrC
VTLTVFEQGSLSVRPRADEELPCLDEPQACALVDAGERMGARIAAWQGPRSLQLQQFVGMVRTGDLEIEILPKLEGLSQPARIRRNLLAMLAKTEDLDVRASEMAGFLESPEPFCRALARLYVHRLLEAVRRGLRQDYRLHQDLLPHVRGRIEWSAQARLQAACRLEIACAFDERSEDTPLNRTLKAALLTAGRMLEETRSARIVTELRHTMDGISSACPPADQRARLQTDRTNRHLEPLLTLAKLILGNRNPDLGRSADGDHDTYSLVWDMNVLFEEYVGRLAQEVLQPEGFQATLQDSSVYLAHDSATRRHAFPLRPDLLVRLGAKPWSVADTKWKRLDPRQTNLGVSPSDLYQVLAYAHRFETTRAVLLYPHHPALGKAGLQKELSIPGPRPVQVRIVTLDLASLEEVPEQLGQGLTGPLQSSPEIHAGR